MSLADELLADLDDLGDELGDDENDKVVTVSRARFYFVCRIHGKNKGHLILNDLLA